MKHYKDPATNELFAYEADGSQDDFIRVGLVPVSNEEAELLRVAAAQALLATMPYTQKRAAEYPSIGDQLDALFHAGLFPAEMAAKLQAIKDKFPKG